MALVVDDPTHSSIRILFAYSFTGLFREAVRYTTPHLKKDRTSIEWKRGSHVFNLVPVGIILGVIPASQGDPST